MEIKRERASVIVSVDAGVLFEIHITPGACQELRLEMNKPVWLVIKTYSCNLVEPRESAMSKRKSRPSGWLARGVEPRRSMPYVANSTRNEAVASDRCRRCEQPIIVKIETCASLQFEMSKVSFIDQAKRAEAGFSRFPSR